MCNYEAVRHDEGSRPGREVPEGCPGKAIKKKRRRVRNTGAKLTQNINSRLLVGKNFLLEIVA
jgi:hypothetical protein